MNKKHLLKLAPALAIAAALLDGCASRPPQPPPPAPATVAVPVSGTELDQANLEKIRLGEVLKAYPVNRYVDPKDPNVLHEAHLVYRKEASADWNLSPHAPTVVPLGPVLAVSDPAEKPAPTNADIEQRMNAQTRLMAALTEQNETLIAEVARLNRELVRLREPQNTATKDK
ncbi:hypothetical protein OH491_19110 [Termitidicoccus mucosus]|uniref:Uncharacterized protein n=1 Tax=Termitidicoccus mucosus TaxID=1184151 RepID=A0A178IJD8_9BACT|nr:hypothetical protein AW736_09515 [Opitutaceae bacterium TSB47]